VPKVDIKKGDYVHVTDFRGNVKYQGIADDVVINKSTCNISMTPLLSIFDVNVVFDRTYLATGTLEQFIADIITDTFISNADTLQNIPGLSVSVTSSTYGASLDLDSNVGELYSIITSALSAHGVLVSVVLDPQEKEINVTIGKVSADSVVIEADLDNVIDRNFVIGDSTAGVNKLTLINQDDETESVTYYLHTDGTVNTTDEDRVTPVFADVAYITGKDFAEKAEGRAVKVLTPQRYNNLIELLYVKADKLLDVDALGIGTPVQVLSEGNAYYSILTGYESSEDTKKLIFGVVRVELTDKLMLEKRATSMRTYAAGATYGPESSTDGNVAVFDGEDGKTVKDSGKKISDLWNRTTLDDLHSGMVADYCKIIKVCDYVYGVTLRAYVSSGTISISQGTKLAQIPSGFSSPFNPVNMQSGTYGMTGGALAENDYFVIDRTGGIYAAKAFTISSTSRYANVVYMAVGS
jgi:hypothetical protein